MKVYYFYKCNDEHFAGECDYYNHSLGVAGYIKKQQRGRFLGRGTVEELLKPKETASHGIRHRSKNYMRGFKDE
jgi:uncharacterized protein YwbE